MFWLWLFAGTYALGGLFVIVLMAMDAKRTNERWPWQSWPLAFLLWFPILAIVLVKQAKQQ